MLNARQSLGAAAADGRGGDEFLKVIGKIGDYLLESDVFASYICHMIAGRVERLGRAEVHGVVLLGSLLGHEKNNNDGRGYENTGAVLRSIVLECLWCWSESNSGPSREMRMPFLELLPFRLVLCGEMAAIGRTSVVLAY